MSAIHRFSTTEAFRQTSRLIQTLSSLPYKCTSARLTGCGYTAEELQVQHDILFPATPLTLVQVQTLLANGAKIGTFNKGCHVDEAEPTVAIFTYSVNGAMASVNPLNRAYVAFLQPASLIRPCPGRDDSEDPYVGAVPGGAGGFASQNSGSEVSATSGVSLCVPQSTGTLCMSGGSNTN